MNWYLGDIGAAITESKQKLLIFLVYVHDSNSTEMNEIWDTEEVSSICKQNCISIRLENGSDPCEQFKQIYPVNVIPTTYLIGTNGRPLNFVPGVVSESELLEKLKATVQEHNLQNANRAERSNQAEATNSAQSQSDQSAKETKSLDERVAEAREKLKQVQEKKRAEEEEKQRASEIERRKMGQEILKAKREKEEQELRKIAEEKRREKLEDELARQKVRERIQQDREEKQKKYNKEKEEAAKSKEEERAKAEALIQEQKLVEAARNSQIARIQFRLLDGSSFVNQFDPNQKLEEVRQYVVNKLKEQNDTRAFTLHLSFPKREYTQEDMNQTLRDLQLAPSASLLIIPKRSQASKLMNDYLPTTSSSSTSSGSVTRYASDMFSLVLLPFTIVWGIITSFFGFGESARIQSSASTSSTRHTNNSYRQNENLRRRPQTSQARNFGTLSSTNEPQPNTDTDDENATWNGNSTQQM